MKTEVVIKIKNLNCDKTTEMKYRQKSKTQIVTKRKNLICDKTKIAIELKSSNINKKNLTNLYCDRTKNINSETQIRTIQFLTKP